MTGAEAARLALPPPVRPPPRRGATRAVSIATSEQRICEDFLEGVMRLARLPPFERQFRYYPGRDFAADFAFVEYRLLIEVQGGIWRRGGGAHSHPTMLLRDIEKAQLAVISGWAQFPVTTDEVRNGKALGLIEIALKAKGWRP